MNEGSYSLLLIIPFLVLVAVTYMVLLVLMHKRKDPRRLLATYAFNDIIKKKTDNAGATRWLLKDICLEDDSALFSKVLNGFFYLSFSLLSGTILVFFQLLFIDISYSCDLEDKNKDCFEFKLWDTSRFSKEPIDCSSAAVQNGTVDVVCYKLVFNAGLAMGASYGVFKVSMAVINVAATGMLMIKQTKTICKVRVFLGVIYVSAIVGLIAVQLTTLRVFLVSDTLANTVQAMATLVVGCIFIIFIPWEDLIMLKNEQSNPHDRGMENMAQA